MCLAASTIDERVTRLHGLIGACSTVTAANSEGAADFAGALAILAEIERDLAAFAAELKASCTGQPEAKA